MGGWDDSRERKRAARSIEIEIEIEIDRSIVEIDRDRSRSDLDPISIDRDRSRSIDLGVLVRHLGEELGLLDRLRAHAVDGDLRARRDDDATTRERGRARVVGRSTARRGDEMRFTPPHPSLVVAAEVAGWWRARVRPSPNRRLAVCGDRVPHGARFGARGWNSRAEWWCARVNERCDSYRERLISRGASLVVVVVARPGLGRPRRRAAFVRPTREERGSARRRTTAARESTAPPSEARNRAPEPRAPEPRVVFFVVVD